MGASETENSANNLKSWNTLNIRTPEIIAVVIIKFEQIGFSMQ